MCITVMCFPSCEVINFEVNLILLIRDTRKKHDYLMFKVACVVDIKLFFSWTDFVMT